MDNRLTSQFTLLTFWFPKFQLRLFLEMMSQSSSRRNKGKHSELVSSLNGNHFLGKGKQSHLKISCEMFITLLVFLFFLFLLLLVL